MASETKAAGYATSQGDGLAAWANTSSLNASDDAWCIAQLTTTNNYSDTLWIRNFGFGIPSSDTILGIQVTVERSRTGLGSPVTITDRRVQLTVSGSAVGEDKADGSTAWPSTDTNKVYGSSSDLWGASWPAVLINQFGFGVLFQCRTLSSSGDTADCNIDYVEITITYSEVVETTPWTDYGTVVRRQRRRVVAPFGDQPSGQV